MTSVLAIVLPFLVYWLILFVACFLVVEYGQTYLYDETTPAMGLKVGLASFLLAALLTWTRTSFDTMLTSEIGTTVLQGIVWFAVFTLVLQFHPKHALGIGIVTMLIVAGFATLAVNSMPGSNRAPRPVERPVSKPLQRPMGPTIQLGPAPKEKAASKSP